LKVAFSINFCKFLVNSRSRHCFINDCKCIFQKNFHFICN
jgi:hypothetical protein